LFRYCCFFSFFGITHLLQGLCAGYSRFVRSRETRAVASTKQ
jgi:hypothetical protein